MVTRSQQPGNVVIFTVVLTVGVFFLASGAVTKGRFQDAPKQKATLKHASFKTGAIYQSVKATAYIPSISGDHPSIQKLQGGSVDRRGQPLRTLQDYLAGKADYVSIAMDKAVYDQFSYGWPVRIPELDQSYKDLNRSGRDYILFRLTDTGGAFEKKGFSRVDICVGRGTNQPVPTLDKNALKQLYRYAHESPVNSHVTLIFAEETDHKSD